MKVEKQLKKINNKLNLLVRKDEDKLRLLDVLLERMSQEPIKPKDKKGKKKKKKWISDPDIYAVITLPDDTEKKLKSRKKCFKFLGIETKEDIKDFDAASYFCSLRRTNNLYPQYKKSLKKRLKKFNVKNIHLTEHMRIKK